MIKKDSKQLRKRKYYEPEAVNILRGISEDTQTSNKINSLKFPFNKIHQTTQEDQITDWCKEQISTLNNQQQRLTKMNFKTIIRDQKQVRKNNRYKVQLKTLTNESLPQNIQKSQTEVNIERKQEQKQRLCCALTNISPDFVNEKKHQVNDYVNGTKMLSSRTKYPNPSLERKALALKKIKKELLHNLQARSKLPLSSPNLEVNNNQEKTKFCSEINFRFNVEPEISNKKMSTPKNIRVLSWHNYIKARSRTVLGCFNQQSQNNFIRLKTDDSAQYKMLKKLLYRQRN